MPFICTAALSMALIVRFFLLDFYSYRVQALLPGASNPIATTLSTYTDYNPATSHILNKALLAGLLGYWSIGAICTFLDLFPKCMWRYKIQGDKMKPENAFGAPSPFPSGVEWWAAVRVSMLNLLCTSWCLTIPLWTLWQRGWVGDRQPMREEDEWELSAELLKITICAIVVDTWFYWTHRLIHVTKPVNLYALIHKLHHKFKAPAAVASMYANPIEFALGNLAGVALGPVLTNCHPYTAYWWFAFALVTTGGSHSGYTFCAAYSHDAHHEFFNYHFGVGGPWDKLCGTDYDGSYLQLRNQKKRSIEAKKSM